MKYGIPVNGRLTEVVEIPQPLPAWAQGSVDVFLSRMFPSLSGWVQTLDDAFNGTLVNGGTHTNPTIPPKPMRPISISRVRFDAIFAAGCGEAYYRRVRRALRTIAETDPPTEVSAGVARGLDALDNPPGLIDFPLGAWKTASDPLDITGSLLKLIIDVLSPSFQDIEAKVDASLAIWSSYRA